MEVPRYVLMSLCLHDPRNPEHAEWVSGFERKREPRYERCWCAPCQNRTSRLAVEWIEMAERLARIKAAHEECATPARLVEGWDRIGDELARAPGAGEG